MDLISKNKKNRHCRDARPCVCTFRASVHAVRLYNTARLYMPWICIKILSVSQRILIIICFFAASYQ